MKRKTTKKALVMSLLSLVLCASMLVGTTFAWFTDSVTSGVNQIIAGNLDVDVYYGDPAQKQSIEGVTTLFNDVTLWEPGAVAYENLTVANLGTLALKYQLSINFANENTVEVDGEAYGLSQILKIGTVEGGIPEGTTREAAIDMVAEADWALLTEYSEEAELAAKTNADTLGVVIWWEPSAEDNIWNVNNGKNTSDGKPLHIDLGVTLVATQDTVEKDSFDETYDESAQYPIAVGGTLEAGANEELVLSAGRVTVTVPADSPAGSYKLNVDSLTLDVNEEDEGDLDTNFAVTKDGAATDDVTYTVQIQVDIMAEKLKVTHKGEEITNFTYDPFTGIVEFETDSFSPFTVDYTIFGKEVVVDADKGEIHSGFFTEVNPASLDETLEGDDSTYMVVSYEKGGETIYSVSERATTEIVNPSDSGKLWSKISGLRNNEHSTVYLMPGTYNEGTTIYVYSSMDIIGMGDTEDIKVVKTSSSGSNRHLFNCSGTKADYIEVTIRNMTLDATAKTTNSKDNAAVQSIRKSKVKCYDLNIIKGTGWDAVAFYVNGNNAVDGVKYPAYLYAENCTLNTTRSFGVVTTSGSYKFFHNGVTYGGTAYTNNSGSIKNRELAWDNWDWE